MIDRFFLDSNVILYAFLKDDKNKSVAKDSEDMQNGLKIDFLTIVNPFASGQKV